MKRQTSFAIVGLTQSELRMAQRFIDIVRSSPERSESILDWLEDAPGDSRLPSQAAYNPGRMEAPDRLGAAFLRRRDLATQRPTV
jgi:hypothetical protein